MIWLNVICLNVIWLSRTPGLAERVLTECDLAECDLSECDWLSPSLVSCPVFSCFLLILHPSNLWMKRKKVLGINRKRDQNNFLGTTDDIKNITQNRNDVRVTQFQVKGVVAILCKGINSTA